MHGLQPLGLVVRVRLVRPTSSSSSAAAAAAAAAAVLVLMVVVVVLMVLGERSGRLYWNDGLGVLLVLLLLDLQHLVPLLLERCLLLRHCRALPGPNLRLKCRRILLENETSQSQMRICFLRIDPTSTSK